LFLEKVVWCEAVIARKVARCRRPILPNADRFLV
jgi:hypothetical protein